MLPETMTDISIQRINSMSGKRIFIDTSAWYAIIDKNDRDHAAAVDKVRILDHPLLTSNYILPQQYIISFNDPALMQVFLPAIGHEPKNFASGS
jgi:hypothetical protein